METKKSKEKQETLRPVSNHLYIELRDKKIEG
jgi:hypothetical protein